jgi:hypothetical protein
MLKLVELLTLGRTPKVKILMISKGEVAQLPRPKGGRNELLARLSTKAQ